MPRKSDTCSTTASTTGHDVDSSPTLSSEEGSDAEVARPLKRGSALGRYVIIDELGQGGTGMVYSAFDPDLDRKVALKVLRKSREPKARARLLREAQAMAKLNHRNVVTVFEVGTDDGRDFVSMEYVDGQNLDDWSQEPHDHEQILAVYRQAGQGLAAAHRAGIVHRDFKPHNVLIDSDARVLVTDFGLARQAAATEVHEEVERSEGAPERPDPHAHSASPDLTRTGAILGTPAYMAPEQHRAQAADARSDQYSFCIALYEALAGHRPFEAADYNSLKEKVLTQKAPDLPDTVMASSSVRAALARGLSQAADSRFDSMDALLLDMEPAPRKRWPLLLIGALAASALVILGLQMGGGDSANQCQADPTVLAGSWDADMRTAVRDAFTKTQVEGAAEVLGKFESLLDGYSSQLVGFRLQMCQASRSQKARDDELMLMQMTCLQKRRQELAALTSAFSNVDARGIDRALEAALALTPVAECNDALALQRGVKGPPAEARELVLALQSKLQEAKSQSEAGRGKTAIIEAEAARDRSLEIGYLPLQTEAQALLGQLYYEELRLAEAEKAYEEAILAAEESGYTEYRARALAGMTRLVASGSSRYVEARRLARRARAAISQWGGNAELSIDVDLAMAVILEQEGRQEEALALLQTTWASVRGQDKTSALQVARLQNRMAGIKADTGDYQEAHSLALSSYELVRSELGDNNPKTIDYLSTLAMTYRLRGDLDEAQQLDKVLRAYWLTDKAQSQLLEEDDYEATTRTIRGRVLGPDGRGAAGATVLCNQRIYADSRFLDVAWDAKRDATHRYVRTESGSDGSFVCKDASTSELVLIADDARVGRSSAVEIPASEAGQDGIALTLMTTGFLSGHVLKDGGPAPAQAISAVPTQTNMANPSVAAVTFLRPDGSYSFERLAPGSYKVFTGPRDSTSSILHSLDVDIVSDQGALLDFDQSEGDAGLALVVNGVGGTSIPSAQVLLVPGHIESQTGREFNASMVAGSVEVRSYFWSQGETLEIEDLRTGLYSVCVVPLGGDYRDPEYMKQFDKDVLDAIPVHCRDVNMVSKRVLEIEVAVEPFHLVPKVEVPKALSTPGQKG